jgi:hypothetical protein
MEPLKFMRHQAFQLTAMLRTCFLQAAVDRAPEIGEGAVVAAVKHLLLDEPPQPLNQVQVRRIRGQEHQFNAQLLR